MNPYFSSTGLVAFNPQTTSLSFARANLAQPNLILAQLELEGHVHALLKDYFNLNRLPDGALLQGQLVGMIAKIKLSENNPFDKVFHLRTILSQIDTLDLKLAGEFTAPELKVIGVALDGNNTIKVIDISGITGISDRAIVTLMLALIRSEALVELRLTSVGVVGLVALEQLLLLRPTLIYLIIKSHSIPWSGLEPFAIRLKGNVERLLNKNIRFAQSVLMHQLHLRGLPIPFSSVNTVHFTEIAYSAKSVDWPPKHHQGLQFTKRFGERKPYIVSFIKQGIEPFHPYDKWDTLTVLLEGGLAYGADRGIKARLPSECDRLLCLEKILGCCDEVNLLSYTFNPNHLIVYLSTLAGMLKINTTVHTLRLPNQPIGDLGMLILLDMVKSRPGLMILKVNTDNLTDVGQDLYQQICRLVPLCDSYQQPPQRALGSSSVSQMSQTVTLQTANLPTLAAPAYLSFMQQAAVSSGVANAKSSQISWPLIPIAIKALPPRPINGNYDAYIVPPGSSQRELAQEYMQDEK